MVDGTDLFEKIVSFDYDTLRSLSYFYFIYGTVTFLILAFGLSAPYGRYVGSYLALKANVAWFIMELPAYVIPVLIIVFGDGPKAANLPNQIFVGLILIHYTHRSFIYPALMNAGKSMTLPVFACAICFCVMNGYLQTGYLLYHADFGPAWGQQPSTYLGILLFFSGLAINIHSDHILRCLRPPGEHKRYLIPKGGMFEYVSGANFFGEIVEWTGFAIATWSLPAFAFAFTTAANLGPRAFHHHRFYKEKFDDYPPQRKALIPFIV